MEYCSKGSLEQQIWSNPQYVYGLTELLYVSYIKQFTEGILYLRLHEIDYWDIKPNNNI